MRSIVYLIDGEHQTSMALFEGLLPFAALSTTDMCLDHAHVDLLCFDYREKKRARPAVVRWAAHDALMASIGYDAIMDELTDEEWESQARVPFDSFLEPVADDFSSLLRLLEPAER